MNLKDGSARPLATERIVHWNDCTWCL